MTDETIPAPDGQPTSIDIHYLKSPSFREVNSDGALGGPTPQGKLWIAFYSERFPLPRVMRQPLKQTAGNDGQPVFETDGPGSIIEARQGIIRSVEFGVYMNKESAEQLRDWITEKLKLLEGEEK